MDDADYKYLLQSHLNKSLTEADRMRCRLMQMNSLRDTFLVDDKDFNTIKLQSMQKLAKIIDDEEGVNNFSGPVASLLKTCANQKQKQRDSKLATRTVEELFKLYHINGGIVGDEILFDDNLIKLPKDRSLEDIREEARKEMQDQEKRSNEGKDDGKRVMSDLFARVGRYQDMLKSKGSSSSSNCPEKKLAQMICSPKRDAIKSKFMNSPPRVSGIMKKSSSPKTGSQQNKSSKNMNDEVIILSINGQQEESSVGGKPMFRTGLEQQLVNKVKKGLSVSEAKKELDSIRSNTFNKRKQMYGKTSDTDSENPLLKDERLKNIEPRLIELICNEIIVDTQEVDWEDVAGLKSAKSKIEEIVVWPMLRPELFTGLRAPPKGLLLFGPPGTGKTMIGRVIAAQSNATFFSITASSLTSKWIGEGEKMVRAMFAVARCKQPAVIFIDEVDSLLSQRSDSEHESSRRIKTEFLAQFEGVSTAKEERLLVVGATNLPKELDEAARRRFSTRLYIPLPEKDARRQIIVNCLKNENNDLTGEQLDILSEKTNTYSGADMTNLCKSAAYEPYRDASSIRNIKNITPDDIRPISFNDFIVNLNIVRPSVSQGDLVSYDEWNQKYGTCVIKNEF